MADAPSPLKIADRCRKTFERGFAYWQTFHDAMRQEERFLGGERYAEDQGSYNRDRRLIQIRGQETQDTIRHIAARATERPRSVEARPTDSETDPDSGEVATSLIEWELDNTWKDFESLYYEAVVACREKRLGVVWMDYDPDCGPFGEMLYRYVSGDQIMWDESFGSPHHPKCAWLWEAYRVPVDEARATYKADWLKPDYKQFDRAGNVLPGLPLVSGASAAMFAGAAPDDGKVTLWRFWWKRDPEAAEQSKGKMGVTRSRQDLKPDDHYLACPECDFQSPTQGKMQEMGILDGDLPGEDDPSVSMPACPSCHENGTLQPLKRIESHAEDPESLHYSDQRRLTVIAPFCAGPDDEPLYDGGWPVPNARSFPGLFLTAYVKPGHPVGPSDTTLMWDQQVAADNLRTMAIQRVFEHRNYWVMPRVGIYDAQGRRYEFRDDQHNVMYRDATAANMGPLGIEQINGAGLDPEFGLIYDLTQAALTQYRGIADLGLTAENSKNIAASTVSQLTQMGEVPLEDFVRRKNRELSKFYGVVWDYIRATYTPERIARLRLDDVDIVTAFKGDNLPNYDFRVEDTPEWSGVEKAKADALDGLLNFVARAMQMGMPVDAAVEMFAEVNNLPRSIVRKFLQAIEQPQQEQMATDPTAAPSPAGVPPAAGAAVAPAMPQPVAVQ